jgi:phage shock protein C
MNGRTIYRNADKAKIAGVVAGLADHFGWNTCYARWAWAIATLFWPPVMIAAYILMAWLLDKAPGQGRSTIEAKLQIDLGRHEPQVAAAPSGLRHRFTDVRDRFGKLETRLRALESVVTSREFQMDRELRRST